MGKSSWGVRPGCFCSCFYHFLFLKKNKNKKASKRKITLYKIGFALITDSSQNLKKKNGNSKRARSESGPHVQQPIALSMYEECSYKYKAINRSETKSLPVKKRMTRYFFYTSRLKTKNGCISLLHYVVLFFRLYWPLTAGYLTPDLTAVDVLILNFFVSLAVCLFCLVVVILFY